MSAPAATGGSYSGHNTVRVYSIHPRWALTAVTVLGLVLALLSAATAVLAAFRVIVLSANLDTDLLMSGIVIGGIIVAAVVVAATSYEVRLLDAGVLEFRKVVGTTRMRVSEIESITNVRLDQELAEIRITARGGWEEVLRDVAKVDGLVDALRQRRPEIRIIDRRRRPENASGA